LLVAGCGLVNPPTQVTGIGPVLYSNTGLGVTRLRANNGTLVAERFGLSLRDSPSGPFSDTRSPSATVPAGTGLADLDGGSPSQRKKDPCRKAESEWTTRATSRS
jgi:hypothetical protein